VLDGCEPVVEAAAGWAAGVRDRGLHAGVAWTGATKLPAGRYGRATHGIGGNPLRGPTGRLAATAAGRAAQAISSTSIAAVHHEPVIFSSWGPRWMAGSRHRATARIWDWS
jgi:hypothetical protein